VRRRGRPPKLSGRQVTQAREWAANGWTQQSIADRLGVAQSVISELLARSGPASVQQILPTATEVPTEEPTEEAVREPVLVEPTNAGGVRGLGPDRHRHAPVPVRRRDAALWLPAPGRRRGDLRNRDRGAGAAL